MLRNEYASGLAPGSTLKMLLRGWLLFPLGATQAPEIAHGLRNHQTEMSHFKDIVQSMFPETGGSQDFSQSLTCSLWM